MRLRAHSPPRHPHAPTRAPSRSQARGSMLDPPADRLDERGYHTVSVTKHGERKVEWSSTTYVDEEGFNVGETVRVVDG